VHGLLRGGRDTRVLINGLRIGTARGAHESSFAFPSPPLAPACPPSPSWPATLTLILLPPPSSSFLLLLLLLLHLLFLLTFSARGPAAGPTGTRASRGPSGTGTRIGPPTRPCAGRPARLRPRAPLSVYGCVRRSALQGRVRALRQERGALPPPCGACRRRTPVRPCDPSRAPSSRGPVAPVPQAPSTPCTPGPKYPLKRLTHAAATSVGQRRVAPARRLP
jgi:hypothetical protein